MTKPAKAQRYLTKGLLASALLIAVAGLGLMACGWWSLETRTPPVATTRQAPDFNLPDHTGKSFTLASLLERGPAVVVFYRGHW